MSSPSSEAPGKESSIYEIEGLQRNVQANIAACTANLELCVPQSEQNMA